MAGSDTRSCSRATAGTEEGAGGGRVVTGTPEYPGFLEPRQLCLRQGQPGPQLPPSPPEPGAGQAEIQRRRRAPHHSPDCVQLVHPCPPLSGSPVWRWLWGPLGLEKLLESALRLSGQESGGHGLSRRRAGRDGSAGAEPARSGVCAFRLRWTQLGVGFVPMRSHLRGSPEFRGEPTSTLPSLERTWGTKDGRQESHPKAIGWEAFRRLCQPYRCRSPGPRRLAWPLGARTCWGWLARA